MESLALLVAGLFLTALLAGPMAIALSSKRVHKFLNERKLRDANRILFLVLDILRKIIHLLLIFLGVSVGLNFLIIDMPIGMRAIGIGSIVLSYIALRREYFPLKFLVRNLLARIGIGKGRGRSSGDDGHGPGGQH